MATQEEMFELPESLPQGVKKVTPLKDRISVLEYAVELLQQLTLDTELAAPDRARLLSAHALVSRRATSKKGRGETDG